MPDPKTKPVTRDAKGRLLPGTASISPGRSTREREHELLSIMRAEVTPEKWLAITRRALEDAATGDGAARSWLSKYLLPEPKHSVEVGGSLADLISALSADNGSTLEG